MRADFVLVVHPNSHSSWLPPGGDMLEGKAHLHVVEVRWHHVLGGRIPGCSWSVGLGSMPPDSQCPFSRPQGGRWWSFWPALRNLLLLHSGSDLLPLVPAPRKGHVSDHFCYSLALGSESMPLDSIFDGSIEEEIPQYHDVKLYSTSSK